MTEINIDELCEPINVTVEGKEYTLEDIPQEVARRMAKLGNAADEIASEIKSVTERLNQARKDGADDVIEKTVGELKRLNKVADEDDSTGQLAKIMGEVLDAPDGEFKILGMRKLTMLVKKVMETITEEIEGKNVPKASATK